MKTNISGEKQSEEVLNTTVKFTLKSFLVTLSLTFPGVGLCDEARLISDIDKLVEARAKKLGVPGGALGIVLDGKVVLKRTAGRGVDSETVFQIGSISKTFTAMVVMRKLPLDNPIKKYLPERCKKNECEGINVGHLLNHTSGIPVFGLNEKIEKGEPYDEIVTRALRAKKIGVPGEKFLYNNAAFELLRESLEKVESRPYAEILKTEILGPLKMTNTSLTFADLKRTGNFFVPHVFINDRFVTTSYSQGYYQFPGAGGVNSNLDDMLKYLTMKMSATAELRILHRPTVEAPDVYTWMEKKPKGMISQYGYGHRVLTFPDLTVVFHTGWIKGCKSILAMFPEKKLGMVILQNSASELGFEAMEDVANYLRQK